MQPFAYLPTVSSLHFFPSNNMQVALVAHVLDYWTTEVQLDPSFFREHATRPFSDDRLVSWTTAAWHRWQGSTCTGSFTLEGTLGLMYLLIAKSARWASMWTSMGSREHLQALWAGTKHLKELWGASNIRRWSDVILSTWHVGLTIETLCTSES